MSGVGDVAAVQTTGLGRVRFAGAARWPVKTGIGYTGWNLNRLVRR